MSGEVMICRTCLNECTTYSHLHKQGIILGEVTSLSTLLNFALCIEMADDTRLPCNICDKCVQMVAKSYVFKKTILEANEHLERQQNNVVELNEDGTAAVQPTATAASEDTAEESKGSSALAKEQYAESGELQELANAAQMKRTMDIMECAMEMLHEGEDDAQVVAEVEKDGTTKPDIEVTEEEVVVHDEEVEAVVAEVDETQTTNGDGDEVDGGEVDGGEVDGGEVDGGEVAYQTEENTIYLATAEGKNYMIEQDEDDEDGDEKYCSETYEVVTLEDGMGEGGHVEVLKKVKRPSDDERHKNSNVERTNGRRGPRSRRPRHEKPPNPEFQCKICDKQLSNQNSYKYHMQLHSDVTPYLCSLCGEGFKTRNAYEGHIVIHDPNNPNTCNICGKSYRQSSSLRTHMMRHTGERPFKCNICGKGLTQKSGYKKHMLTHTGEKPHVCDICNREFRYSSNLLAHRRCHSGEKPYECDECQKTFPTAEQLKRHRLVHSENRPFSCSVCPKKFKRRSSMLVHRSIHDSAPALVDQKVSKSNVVELY